MLEVSPMLEGGVVGFRLFGAVTDREFDALAAEAGHFEADGAVLVYCDWLGVEGWEFSAPKGDRLSAWRRAAGAIARVSIVHDHRLKRQAAWLAAMLRDEGVAVRCWRPQQVALAANWLGMSD